MGGLADEHEDGDSYQSIRESKHDQRPTYLMMFRHKQATSDYAH